LSSTRLKSIMAVEAGLGLKAAAALLSAGACAPVGGAAVMGLSFKAACDYGQKVAKNEVPDRFGLMELSPIVENAVDRGMLKIYDFGVIRCVGPPGLPFPAEKKVETLKSPLWTRKVPIQSQTLRSARPMGAGTHELLAPHRPLQKTFPLSSLRQFSTRRRFSETLLPFLRIRSLASLWTMLSKCLTKQSYA